MLDDKTMTSNQRYDARYTASEIIAIDGTLKVILLKLIF